VAQIETLHAERAAERKLLRNAGGQQLHVGVVSFGQRQLNDVELAHGSMNVARVFTEDILAGLRGLGVEPAPESKPIGFPDQPVGVRDAG
jgi:hypothetical protein